MHVKFPASWRTYLLSTMRFAVPFFFMVSGYFTFDANDDIGNIDIKAKHKVSHIGRIVFFASVFYILFAALQIALGGESLTVRFLGKIEYTFLTNGPLQLKSNLSLSPSSIIIWLFLNIPTVIVGQMWFLFALLYVYIVYYIAQKCFLQRQRSKIVYVLIPVLLAGYVLLAQVAYVMGYSLSPNFYRNWLFLGLPFFFIGRYIHEYYTPGRLSNRLLLSAVLLFTALCPLERFLFGRTFGVQLCSIPQVLSLFLLSVNNPDKFQGNVFQRIGTKYSMYIYIFHPFVWHTTEYFYDFLGLADKVVAQYAMPVVVILISILLSMLYYKIICRAAFRRRRYAGN